MDEFLQLTIAGLALGARYALWKSPENLTGGWFLAWAYLKSGSILMPLLLHSLGNLAVIAGQVAAWYWMHGG